ncbi:MAG: glycosyltransferase N-terminal domain-containing protein [Bacteroidales bacterium]
MRFIYNLGILIFVFLTRILSPFNSKARLWSEGRKNWEASLKRSIKPGNKYLWIHCASLGEFEQGRPVIELLKKEKPEYKIVLTFFSPSGYEIRKNYTFADYVCYLPADTPGNSKKFISILNPVLAIFVKYEFWNNYISVLYGEKIPLYLISAIFRAEQPFFRWYGAFFRRMLFRFSHIFVQDEHSCALLKKIGVEDFSVAGDTRFDRVVQIAKTAKDIPELEAFSNGEKILLAGSSWQPDEEIIARYINRYPENMKWVFAPHEIDKPNIERIEKLFTTKVVRFSEFTEKSVDARVMIIDNIGMLSSAYRYAWIAAIGGGFGKGIHNVLEAACWGIPVVFGPNFKKFREASDLINLSGARSFRTFEEFSRIVDDWLIDTGTYLSSAKSAADYVKRNAGATAMIFNRIVQKDMNNKRS